MVKISILIIGSKEHLKIIKPYLTQSYVFRDEIDVVYNIGKGKADKILKLCTRKKIGRIIFLTTNETTHLVTNKLSNIQGKTYFIPNYAYSDITNATQLEKATKPFDISKPCLKYVEMHAADHCNLNCKGCSHYSNIEPAPNFPNINQYITDLKKVKKLFWNISTIRLVGGEPLLNPMLGDFIDVTRAFFPMAEIRIATNGLLIPKLSSKLIKQVIDAKAGFDITNYPPTNKIKDKICHILNTEKIPYRYRSPAVTKFDRKLTKTPINNEMESFHVCSSQECHLLKDGIIATCPLAALAYKYNNAFGTDLPTNCGYVLSEFTDGWKLYHQLCKPFPLCRYCVPGDEPFDWEICPKEKAKAEDWLVDENKIIEVKHNSQELKRNSQKHPVINTYLDNHKKIGKYVRYCLQKIRN